MSLTIGRLALDDPESWPEMVGESVGRSGAAPTPGGRSGLSVSAGLTSFTATGGTVAERQEARRQLRSLLNNLPMRIGGVYVAWSEDPEQNGWYVPGRAGFDVAGEGALQSAFWKFAGCELALIGRRRTHRRGVECHLRDRRLSTVFRDHDSKARIYSTDFSAMTAVARIWLPSGVTDPVITGFTSLSLTGARTGYGSSSIIAAIDPADLAVVHFEQSEATRNVGDVVVYDRRGTLTAPTGGPDAAWEEVYGSDWEATGWLAATDVPVLDNSLCRVRYDSANTDGFAVDRWTGAAWAEQGKVLAERQGASTAYCDSLISADVIEWAPERAVVRAVMKVASDALSREEVLITLQRGWNGPRFEVFPAPKSGGAAAGAGIAWYRVGAPAGTETANKFDASLQTVTGVANFTPGVVGAATFSGENWIAMRRTAVNALILAGLQAGAAGRVENNTSAYGSARNGIAIRSASTARYVSAHLGMNAANTTDAIDSVNGQYDGARDLGKEILYDARPLPTIVSR